MQLSANVRRLETCHPERSEGSLQLFGTHRPQKPTAEILRFAQDDSYGCFHTFRDLLIQFKILLLT